MKSGIQFIAAISISPDPIFPTTPNAYITAAIVAAKTECIANRKGAINRNVNSNGSVIPTKTAVSAAGIRSPATTFFFSGRAVLYIAKAIPIAPNILLFPCSANPPAGKSSFNGRVEFAKVDKFCAQAT